MEKREQILKLLERDAQLTVEQLAVMVDMKEEDAANIIREFEQNGTIVCRKTVIDWEKTDYEKVSALIELRVTPQMGEGFDKVAKRVMQYPEVRSAYLMSGGFDLMVIVEGMTMKEVALFVANCLAPMDEVISTATHFVLKKYKQEGVVFGANSKDERRVITL